MLPNQSSNLSAGYHRRQNSTPTVPIAPKVPHIPVKQVQYANHRRGLSLDQVTYNHRSLVLSQQDENPVSIDQGPQQDQQHTLREAQQQYMMARPGHLNNKEKVEHNDNTPRYIQPPPEQELGMGNIAGDEFSKQLPDSKDELLDFFNKYEQKSNGHYHDLTASAGYLEGLGSELNGNNQDITRTGDMDLFEMTLSDGLPQKESSRPESTEAPLRPQTPVNQTNTSYFPMTPATTPFAKSTKAQRASQSRTAGSSPIRRDPNMTIEASHVMQRGSSWQDPFPEQTSLIVGSALPSPPKSGRHKRPKSFDISAFPPPDFLSLESLKMEFPTASNEYNASHYSPMSNAMSPTLSSFQPSPELAHMSLFGSTGDNMTDFPISSQISRLPVLQNAVDLGMHASPVMGTSKPRSQSIPELDIDIDASIEDTGVTSDEIAAFICGPDPVDQKWTCIYDACGKKFGRKENIKSHVQTHLGDRQFRCNHCNKCFVRQHDLKRHGKIHSGIKPYVCPCGNGFARHDALTRHRQRDTCVGGFGGAGPKQPARRGRPKKTRPITEERLEKAARTRQRVLEKAYASSISDSSDSSYPSPPEFFDDMQVCETDTFDNIGSLPSISEGLPPDFFTYTPPTSPGFSTGNCHSSRHSQHSQTPKVESTSPSPRMATLREDDLGSQLDLITQAMSRASSATGSDESSEPEIDVDKIFQDLLGRNSLSDQNSDLTVFSDKFNDFRAGLEDPLANPWAEAGTESSTQFFDQELTLM